MYQRVNLSWKIALQTMIVISSIFEVDTKIIFVYNFEAPLSDIIRIWSKFETNWKV